ncbi:MAG: PDC sensor domain-containing protein, partial [Planctomycetota bacterium]
MWQRSVVLFVFSLGLFLPLLADEEVAPLSVWKFCEETLSKYGVDPVVVKAVRFANATGASLEDVQQIDTKWCKTEGIDEHMRAMMDSQAGRRIKRIKSKHSFLTEIFVTDRLGANVAMTDKTPDFWQGDEDEFLECFRGGKGKLRLGPVKRAKRAPTRVAYASVPVTDEKKTIGVVVLGIDLTKFEAFQIEA